MEEFIRKGTENKTINNIVQIYRMVKKLKNIITKWKNAEESNENHQGTKASSLQENQDRVELQFREKITEGRRD